MRPSRTPATDPSAITPDSTHRSLKPVGWKRLPIIDSRVQTVWNTLILSTISLNLSLWFPLDLSCLCIQCLVKDENDALPFERALDLERLHQNLVNGSHVSGWCVNSRQISDDILWDLHLATDGNIESCPAKLASCFSSAWNRTGIQSKFFFLASAKVSSALTSTNVLARELQRSPALCGGTAEITQRSILLFLVLAYSIPGDGWRLGPKCLPWTALPFTQCDVPAPERVSYYLKKWANERTLQANLEKYENYIHHQRLSQF